MSDPRLKDELYLRHILDAIGQVEEYLAGVSRDVFDANRLLQDGVVRQLEIIGEASKRLSAESKNRASAIPWRQVAGMRDKLIHDYMGVELDAVWDTAQIGLPPLKRAVQDLLG